MEDRDEGDSVFDNLLLVLYLSLDCWRYFSTPITCLADMIDDKSLLFVFVPGPLPSCVSGKICFTIFMFKIVFCTSQEIWKLGIYFQLTRVCLKPSFPEANFYCPFRRIIFHDSSRFLKLFILLFFVFIKRKLERFLIWANNRV